MHLGAKDTGYVRQFWSSGTSVSGAGLHPDTHACTVPRDKGCGGEMIMLQAQGNQEAFLSSATHRNFPPSGFTRAHWPWTPDWNSHVHFVCLI